MLSHAGHGPGGKSATSFRRHSKVAVVLQWQQPCRLYPDGDPLLDAGYWPKLKLSAVAPRQLSLR